MKEVCFRYADKKEIRVLLPTSSLKELFWGRTVLLPEEMIQQVSVGLLADSDIVVRIIGEATEENKVIIIPVK